MKYLFDELPKIVKKASRANPCLLILDFDGTLSPVAPTPAQASINKSAKAILTNLVKRKKIHIAIISGRTLADVKNKVSIKGLIYAGNHGLEWQVNGKRFFARIPKDYKKIVPILQEHLSALSNQYKGTFIENKGMSMAVHYRLLNKNFHKSFRNKVVLTLKPFVDKNMLSITAGNKVMDIKPRTNWNKGRLALYLKKALSKGKTRPFIIYIGDDATDEDAFKALRKNITIRVGRKQSSAARYFVKNTDQTSAFLAKIAC